jgi:hypothetical protein
MERFGPPERWETEGLNKICSFLSPVTGMPLPPRPGAPSLGGNADDHAGPPGGQFRICGPVRAEVAQRFCSIDENGIEPTGLYIDEIIQLDSLVKAGVLKAAQFEREKGNGPLNRLRDWAQLRMPGEFHRSSVHCVKERLDQLVSEYSVISPSLLRDRRCIVPAPFHTESLF